MGKEKIVLSTDQRKFTIVYNDFLESQVLDSYEKIIFITLKKYADNETHQAFPSLRTLRRMTGISINKIQQSIESMAEKGVIRVEKRISKKTGNMSNLYTLHDYASIWRTNSPEAMKMASSEVEEEMMIQTLQAKGYTITKTKKPVSTTDQSMETDPSESQLNNVITTYNSTPDSEPGQERYSMDDLKDLFGYADIITERPEKVGELDAVMQILYELMNSRKKTVYIAGENRPAMVVMGKLMKLSPGDILYAIDQFGKQTDRIQNPEAYMKTLLYKAKEQRELDLTNQVMNDMYGEM